jgi:hypothetical protein
MASPECAGIHSVLAKMNVISGVFGLISDVYILIIPMPAVWKLNIRKEKKVGVYVIFSSGAL